ncbi:glycosyltransferase [Ameyamaea chiangmaiensis]|nr:glycosyltransferase [Ameyamaea chiangmaiensis]
MRILHAIATHEFAGSERYVAELSAAQARDHDVTVLLQGRTRDRCTGGDIRDVLDGQVRVARAGPGGYCLALGRALRQIRPDIVHTHLGRASMRARLLSVGRVPTIATLHNRFSPRVYGGHDGLICVARWQTAGIPPGFDRPVDVIGNWTCVPSMDAGRRADLRARWGFTDDTYVFGGAGRFVSEKGFDTLIRAFERLPAPNVRLVLFGDGPERAALEALAGPRVKFGGFSKSLPTDLSALDAFVLPSRCEPFGLVLLEAMANGLPVLATRAGGVPDILGDHSPDLVPPDDSVALAEAMRRRIGVLRRDWDMTRFRRASSVARIEQFYDRVLGRERAAAAVPPLAA